MELLLLLLLSPSAILCQRYRSGNAASANPNDEPFLPIYPVYPYSPKLMKRGTETDLMGPLTAELYAPKVDARDTYTNTFNANYQRDPYYPSYNPYPKSSNIPNFPLTSPVASSLYNPAGTYNPTGTFASPSVYGASSTGYGTRNTAAYTTPASSSYTPYNAAYSTPYPYTAAHYGMYNSYNTPYPSNPYGSYSPASYPNYNYQAPYYYPGYYNQPYPPLPPPPPPPPPSQMQDYQGSSTTEDSSTENDTEKKSNGKKSEAKKNRYKDESDSETKDEQFVDGGNYLSSTNKDLDGQSTSYKAPNAYNQLEQMSDLHLRSVPIPGISRTTYRVISVGGQPVGPDYPLPPSYAKVQQLEQIMGQTLAKLLAQNQANQGTGTIHQYRTSEPNDQVATYPSTGFVNKSPPGVIAKTGLAYVMNSNSVPKLSNLPGQYVDNYGNSRSPVIIKVQDPSNLHQSGSTVLSKVIGAYGEARYPQKSLTTVSLQQAPGVYIPPEAKDIKDENNQSTSEYDYDANPSPSYESANGAYKKNEQNYSLDQAGQAAPYHNSNLVTVQTPQPPTYQYSSYLPAQSDQQQQQQQARDYSTNLDDVNFGKRNTKA